MTLKKMMIGVAFMLMSCASTGIDTGQLDSLDKATSAKLRLASGDKGPGGIFNAGPIVTVRKYSDQTCESEITIARMRNGTFNGLNQKSLDIPLNDFHKNAATETYIEANEPVTFLFHLETMPGQQTIYECGIIMQTTFEVGKEYELSVDFLPFSDFSVCKADLNEIVTTPSGSSRKFIKSFDNSAEGVSETCVNAFEKWRWF